MMTISPGKDARYGYFGSGVIGPIGRPDDRRVVNGTPLKQPLAVSRL
jgi:hypothetical protein